MRSELILVVNDTVQWKVLLDLNATTNSFQNIQHKYRIDIQSTI